MRQKGTVIEYRTKDGDTVFRGQYRDASRRQVRETFGRKSEGWTKTKAEEALRERISLVSKKGYRKPEPVLFKDYAWRWFEETQGPQAWKPATTDTYRYCVRRLVEHFGDRRLTELRRPDLNRYISGLTEEGLAARTVNLLLTVVYMIFEKAVDEGLLLENPAHKVKRPKEPRYKPRALSASEARSVEAKIADPTVKLAFVTFEVLGLRFNELRNLRWRDIDLLGKRLRVTDAKTHAGERSVAIPPRLAQALEDRYQWSHYRHETDYVFCHPEKGSRMSPETYRETVKEAVKAAGISDKFRPAHDLRVTSITSGVLAGEHTSKLMARVGHTDYATTKRYIDLAGEVFPDEAARLEELRFGKTGRQKEEGQEANSSQVADRPSSGQL
jgi:integrase